MLSFARCTVYWAITKEIFWASPTGPCYKGEKSGLYRSLRDEAGFIWHDDRPMTGQILLPVVGVIMGSKSDWDSTMIRAHETLKALDVPHECRVVSAHRTPKWMVEYAQTAANRGLEVIIAGAGGAAHLPGMTASETLLPVIGVPVQSRALNGLDSLLSINQMPSGVPVATMAIGPAGAVNAALLAARILARTRPELGDRLHAWTEARREAVMQESLV